MTPQASEEAIAKAKARHDVRVTVLLASSDKRRAAEAMKTELVIEGKPESVAALIVREAWGCAKAKAGKR